ncbi:MAG: glycine cleavage system protein H [Pelagibacteraceae bacterium]|jgi:glycine cleavage system H protein|nr:glycine cleavage system protein H [Pelagibacteraceae bacterium]|tara:strand:- start:4504 stop:4884 length:381 start_codon:yes stop_codon:yes gene_type:complete
MSEKKFSKKHEWVSLEGDIATVGITKHATEMLGDIVFAEVPEAGKVVEKEGQAAVVESTKAASDVYSPISGEITEGNKAIVGDPSSVNSDPEGASWFFKLKVKDKGELDSLMSKEEYEKFVAENPS